MPDEQSKPILEPPWKELVKIISLWNYGTAITHSDLAALIGLEYPKDSQDYYQCVHRANKDLLQLQKLLRIDYGVGYVVANPNEYAGESKKKTDQSIRRARIAIAIIVNTPVELLTHGEKQILNSTANNISRRFSMMVKTARALTKTEMILLGEKS